MTQHAPILTVSELREVLQPRPADDHLLEPLRNHVVALWERETAFGWTAVDGVEYVVEVAPSQPTIAMPYVRVRGVSKVEVRSAVEAADFEEIDASGFLLIAPRSLRRLGSVAGWSGLVRVTADVGIPGEDVPADVKQAIITQIRFLIERNRSDAIALSSKGSSELGTIAYLTADLHPLFARAAAARARRD